MVKKAKKNIEISEIEIIEIYKKDFFESKKYSDVESVLFINPPYIIKEYRLTLTYFIKK